MLSIRKWIWLIGLGLTSTTAVHGQTVTACPPGMVAYGAGVCGYDQDENQQVAETEVPRTPPQQWATTWGAITSSVVPKGVLGTSTDLPTENSAMKAALQDCRSKGGTACKVELTYYNQCAALVVGHPGYVVYPGETLGEAIHKSMAACISAGNENCRVLYSACSFARRIQ